MRRRLPASWRIRIRAAARMADEALQAADSYIAALLDVRSLRSVGCEAAARLGSTWRRHRDAARIREYGPGRGLLAVIITRPASENAKEHK
jgi:hypothetical protein